MLAEVWVVRYSRILVRELGIHYLIVKLDAMEIVLASTVFLVLTFLSVALYMTARI